MRRRPNRDMYAEAEIVCLVDRPLAGPCVTVATARAALAAVYPGFDMPQFPKDLLTNLQSSKGRRLSGVHGFVSLHELASMCSPADTTIVLGAQAGSPFLDLRTEGVLVSVDGRVRSSAAAWETLAGPLNSVVWLANELAKYGARIEPGQIVVTGAAAVPPRVEASTRVVSAEFTRLGTVTAVITD